MKSLPQDRKIKTSCKNCAFAKYDNITQIGCDHNRIVKFGDDCVEAYDKEKEFYIIDRLCNYYRDKAWGYSQKDIDNVKKESAVSFDIIFDCTSIDNKKKNNIIESINNSTYYDNKINFILLQTKINDRYDAINSDILEIHQKINKKITISVCENIQYFVHNLLIKSKNSYHAFIDKDAEFSQTIFDKIEKYVNEELKRFLVAKYKNIRLIRNLAYKYLNNISYNPNYFENIETIVNNCQNTEAYIEL